MVAAFGVVTAPGPFRAAFVVALGPLTGPRLATAAGPLADRLASTDPVTVFQAVEDAIVSKDVANAGALLSAGWQLPLIHISQPTRPY